MPLNEQDRQTVINALTAANNAIEAAKLELEKIKQQLVSILRDIQD